LSDTVHFTLIGEHNMQRSLILFSARNRPTPQFADLLKDVGIPGATLAEIDTALQARFFQKKPDGSPAERWELKGVGISWTNNIRQGLANCGFMSETQPSRKIYDYAAWPGALVTRAAVRLSDLIEAKKGDGNYGNNREWSHTIVFGGKRPLQPDKENYEKCCEAIGIPALSNLEPETCREADRWDYLNPQTELDMMRWLWDCHPGNIRQTDGSSILPAANFIDTPMKPPFKEGGQPTRPTTEDTVNEWLKSNPMPGTILLSSGAPYGMAMDEAFSMLLEPHGFTVETFGHAAPDLPIENFMREVAGTVNRIRRARKA
jgi:hypothetical protein